MCYTHYICALQVAYYPCILKLKSKLLDRAEKVLTFAIRARMTVRNIDILHSMNRMRLTVLHLCTACCLTLLHRLIRYQPH